MSQPVLIAKNLSKRYGENVIFNNISLTVQERDTIVIVGPSGTGKSTLLRCLNLLTRAEEGQIWLDGQEITAKDFNEDRARQQIGMVFQNFLLFNHLTAVENIMLGLTRVKKMHRAEARLRAMQELAKVDLADRVDHFPGQLSGGQQQRVALARCLAIRPRILLLDEPFSALDKNLRLDMQIEIKRLQRQSGITTVLVTHDQEEALGMSDRIAVLNRGNLEQFAAPSIIYDRPASVFVNTFVGTTNLLPGTLVAPGIVRLDGGGTVETALASAAVPGMRILLSARPEAILLAHDCHGAAMQGTVTDIMPLGPSVIYQIRLTTGQAIKIVQDRDGGLAFMGQAVFVSLKPGRASGIFPMQELSP